MSILSGIKQLFSAALTSFGYDAVLVKNKRKPPTGLLRSEDLELLADDRRKLVSTGRDINRNFSIAAWMVRQHLDYVTTFTFQAKTGNDALDEKLEKLIRERGKRKNCDVSGRFGIRQMLRIAEARRVVDNDCFLMKLASGALQPIEGDRIRSPIGEVEGQWVPMDAAGRKLVEWIQGVQIVPGGRPINYAVWRRGNIANMFILDRIVPAENIYHHAIFERFDQVRGVSPLAASLNTLRDCYEGFDAALAKMKVSQLFGLSIYRQSSEQFGQVSQQTVSTDESDAEDGDDDTSLTSPGYKVDFNQGPFLLDLDDNDRAEFLESKSPSLEFQAWAMVMIGVALKALDIPYSYYDESFTNYTGSRGAVLRYEASAEVKRDRNRELLDWWTDWQIEIASQDGYFTAEELATLAEATEAYCWLHRGTPWLDPLKEVQAELRACDAAFDNPEDVAQRHGRNVYENIDKIAKVNEYAVSKGVRLNTMIPLPSEPQQTDPDADPMPGDHKKPASGQQPADNENPNDPAGEGMSTRHAMSR